MSKTLTNFQKEELIKLLIELKCSELVANYYVPDLGPDIYHLMVLPNDKLKDTLGQYVQEESRSIKVTKFQTVKNRDKNLIKASPIVIFVFDHEYYTENIRQARSMKKKVIIIPPITRPDTSQQEDN